MKLVIQIPCLNEAEVLPVTLGELPRHLPGFDAVEYLVVDDGSTDETAEVAHAWGVDHVVRLNGHKGLARAFMTGLRASLAAGADVVVNTDADNQYQAADIAALVGPILEGRADIVIGARPIRGECRFSLTKQLLQLAGSRFVRALSGARVRDAPSGFRAFSRDAALRLNVFGTFTYTLETIIQAGLSDLRIISAPVGVNPPTRPSRLFANNLAYVSRSVRTILATYLVYRPARLFAVLSVGALIPGAVLLLRYLFLMEAGEGRGHIQSVIVGTVLVLSAVVLGSFGIVAHLQGINRRLLEEIVYHSRSASLRAPDGGGYADSGLEHHHLVDLN